MAKNDGGPAYPQDRESGAYGRGMSLRDWFAGRVIPQIWAEDCANVDDEGMTLDEMAHEAYRMADAMLAERDK